MNFRLVLRLLGLLLCCEAAAMLLPLSIAAVDQSSDLPAFIISIAVIGTIGTAISLIKPRTTQVGYKEGFLIATMGWALLAFFGAVPFVLSGVAPNPADALFESMSGFTTTGASVITDVEALPRGILLWRSLTHWLGGMGIIVLTLALLPSLNVTGVQLFRAEVSGPIKSKVLPRVAEASRQLYKVYLAFTVAELLLLKLCGLTWFDSLIHTFSTVATGGFSSQNLSVGAYQSLPVELIIVFFMLLGGINFNLHYHVIKGEPLAYFKDAETRVYLGIVLVASLVIINNLVTFTGCSILEAARQSLFQVVSLITGTGFATVDFDKWPDFSRYVLIALMFIGGCAGSTSGGIKVIRFIVLFKAMANQLLKLIHPQAVLPLRVGNRVLQPEVVQMVQNFFVLFLAIFAAVTGYLTFLGLDLISAATATVAAMSNVGPGLGLVGPTSTFAALPDAGKLVLTFCMLIGRLELFTVLVLLSVRFWK